MASSLDAFAMFSKWKKLNTLLNFTDFSSPLVSHIGHIYHVEEPIVGFAVEATHDAFPPIDLSEADFEITSHSVRATHPNLEDLLFEETKVC